MGNVTAEWNAKGIGAHDARMCVRMLEREGLLGGDGACEVTKDHPLPIRFSYDTRDERERAWCLESLYVALTHAEPLIAFRAYGQARSYIGTRCPDAATADAMRAAQSRCEAWVTMCMAQGC